MPKPPRFSERTLEFLKKASRQKRPDWLERNRAEYEEVLVEPLRHFSERMRAELGPHAPGYHFPLRGLGRIKRPADRAREDGRVFKNWLSWSAARPRESRFTHNPNLYFMIHGGDAETPILSAGGLYMPSSEQTRAIRAAIAEDASAFERLFRDREFRKSFPEGFSDERISSRPVRGYDRDHPRMDWIRLQAFFVWRPYTRREFFSAGFADLVARDLRQVLRLNALLDLAVQGRLPRAERPRSKESVIDRLEGFEAPRRQMDF